MSAAADPQKQGADPRASAFVSANAGSGKTRVLVDRAARLLLAGAQPARILCLTFTKAAASEMQDRLYQRLGAWTIAPDDTLREELRELTGGAPDLAQARRLFARALDTPGGLNVQTIHAFCERLLRNFPIEAGLDPGFIVLEEADAARLNQDARRDVAVAAARDPAGAAARAFEALAAARSDRAADAAFSWIIARRHSLSDLFEVRGGLEPVLRALRARLGLPADATAESIMRDAWERTPKARLRGAASVMQSGGKTDMERAAKLLSALAENDPEIAWPLYMQAVRTQKGERFSGGLCSKGVAESAPHVAELFGARETPGSECARIDTVQAHLKAARCADLSAATLTLGHAFIAAYEARKRRLRALDFTDLIHRARRLLTDSEARDWVLFKLDGGVDHILVDEAQDNSPEQWEIVGAAAAEFFTGEGVAQTLRTLFAVGDEKQSIFSFQGADPAQFRGARAHYAALAAEAGLTFNDPPLLTSFRSAPNILSAVDHVFTGEVAARLFAGEAQAGEPMQHLAHRADRTGVVELWPALPAADAAEDGDPAAPVDAPAPDSPPTALARLIAQRIRDMIAGGASVHDKDEKRTRAVRAGDALILVRRRNAFFEEMIRQLKIAGLPVAGADRMRLTDQTAVKDLLALARFALLPEDDLSLAELLRSPFFQPAGGEPVITEQALFDLAQPRTGRLWTALRETADARFAEAKIVLGETLARVGVAAPYDFFSRFLNRLAPEGASFARRLYARLGPEAEDPIEEFLARALAHQRKGPPSLQRFLAEIEAEGAAIKREMEAARDEVRVMTVHGAKGLEAPVVFLPDTTSYKRRPGEGGLFEDAECGLIWSPRKEDDPPAAALLRADKEARDDAEYLRLLYVALTRARDHLIVCGWRMGPRNGRNPEGRIDEGCWHELVQAGLERAGAIHCETPAGQGLMLGVAPEAAQAETVIAGAVIAPEWTRQMLAPERRARLDAPSKLLTEEGEISAATSPLSGANAARYLRGSLIHKLLELLPLLPEGEREAAGRKWLGRRAQIDAAAQEDVLAATLRVLAHPDFAQVFGPGSRAEVPIAGALPSGARVSGAIDRLVVTPADILVVDYKTNRPPPATIADTDPAYIAQMAAYRAVLESVFPGRAVRCALLWTDTPVLMEVPAGMMDGALRGPLAA